MGVAGSVSCTVVIQARMGSKRFPGKSLHPFRGTPSLGHLLDATLQAVSASQIRVATSLQPNDDPVARYCDERGISVFRGDEDNVASRFYAIAAVSPTDFLARLNGDSPLFDHRILQDALRLAEWSGADIISTSVHQQYPSGMHVELLRRTTFHDAYPAITELADLEHVTPFFYRNASRYRIEALPAIVPNAQRYRFSFDTSADRDRIERLFLAMERPHFAYTLGEKCALHERLFGAGSA